MADQKLADMDLGSAVSAADLFYTEQSGVQKKITGEMLAANTANYLGGLATTTTLSSTDLLYVNQTVDKAITLANLMLNAAARRIRAVDYGAKFDGLEVSGCTIATAAATVSSANYTFTSADIGKIMVIKATPTSTTYVASAGSTKKFTISSVAAGVATLNSNIGATSSTAIAYFGTDDTAAIQAAMDAGNPYDAALGGSGTWLYKTSGVVELPVGMALTTSELKIRPCVSVVGQDPGATIIKWASGNTMAVSGYYGIFNGGEANGSSREYLNVQFRNIKFDATAAFTTSYSYHSKCIEMIFAIRPVVMNCWFEGSPGTAYGCDYLCGALVYGNRFENCGRLWAPGGGGGSGLDFQTGVDLYVPQNALLGINSRIVANNHFINCAVSAVRNTNNYLGYQESADLITGNMIKSNLSTGKGIEDNGNLGAVITSNVITHSGTAQSSEGPIGSEGQHIWCGIITTGGQNGIIANNTIQGGWYDGIRLNRFMRSGATITPVNYLVTGNVVTGNTRNGIRAEIDSTYTMSNVGVTNNTVGTSGQAGISLTNTGTGGDIKFLDLSGNRVYDNGATTATDAQKSGIYINTTLTGAKINDNYIYDSGTAKQKYGITIDTVTCSYIMMNDNHANQNTTATGLNLVSTGNVAAANSKTKDNLGIADV